MENSEACQNWKMDQENIIQIKREFQRTHFFVYKNQKFPFNFELFKITSQYFFNLNVDNERSKFINLLQINDDEINLDYETIKLFIQYVHREKIQLDKKNVIQLKYLADLIESTEQYINKHHSELVLEILYLNELNENIKMSTYEDIISEHFHEYIEDERLFNLQISTIYRLLKKSQEKKKLRKS